MLFQTLFPLALLAQSVAAKPVAREAIPHHDSTDVFLPGMTQTSTDSDPSSPESNDTPVCTATYTPSKDETCNDIATNRLIHLHKDAAGYASSSKECRDILRGLGICSSDKTHGATNNHARSPQSAVSSPNTVYDAAYNQNDPNVRIISSATGNIVAEIAATEETVLTSTFSYTLGPSGYTSVTSVVVTQTTSAVVTFTTTMSAIPTTAILPSTSTTPPPLTSSAPSTVLITMPTPDATCSSITPPSAAVTQAVVAGCTEWYTAIPGDYCYIIAQQFGIPVTVFMSWNPTINAPWCTNLQAGSAYCVATCESNATVSVPVNSQSVIATSVSSPSQSAIASTSASGTAPSGTAGADVYNTYLGDGSVAQGWPSEDQWVGFDSMFAQNRANMGISCAQWGVPDDSDIEISDIQTSILSTASTSNIDARFILAIILQESQGCVRVITTAYSHANPGLMQSNNGTGSCNTNMAPLGIPGVADNGVVQTPCPASEIQQMISDGTEGTIYGNGLVQLLAQQGDSGAQGYYRAARLYNGGSIAADGLLQDGCCTASYVSDVANRLTGWVNAPRTFSG